MRECTVHCRGRERELSGTLRRKRHGYSQCTCFRGPKRWTSPVPPAVPRATSRTPWTNSTLSSCIIDRDDRSRNLFWLQSKPPIASSISSHNFCAGCCFKHSDNRVSHFSTCSWFDVKALSGARVAQARNMMANHRFPSRYNSLAIAAKHTATIRINMSIRQSGGLRPRPTGMRSNRSPFEASRIVVAPSSLTIRPSTARRFWSPSTPRRRSHPLS